MWKFPAMDNVGGSAPFVYEDNVFIGSEDKHLYSIQTRTGRQNWRFATGGPIYTSPRVRFEHAFFGSDDGHFYAVNVKTGRSAWKARAYGAVRSTPFVDDERVFFWHRRWLYFFVWNWPLVKPSGRLKQNVMSPPPPL
ncbi:MAG: PQQ-binding-like beta-propeller repeat protein [Anaerolineae bacterium]|nr:PQQ-binding-like beta-propeller repeat protein [Anaerolineae bacterium]